MTDPYYTKTIRLWGGPLDGQYVRVEPDAEVYACDEGLWAPAGSGDYASNTFRYITEEGSVA